MNVDNVEEAIVKEILEGMHQFVGNDFSFSHNDVDDTLKVVEYTEEGDILRRHTVYLTVRVDTHG